MFNTINWDTLGDLLSDVVAIFFLCVFLYIWAARVRMRDIREREAAARQNASAPEDTASAVTVPPGSNTNPRNDPPT
jgi:hypothetical protein